MTLKFDVIVAGSYSVDLIFTGMDEFPQPGKDVIAKNFNMTPGEAYITAVSMHRLGIKVGWAADFGNDDFSHFALECARNEGLDESLFVQHDRPYRRISAAASYPTERGFLTYYDPEPTVPAALPALMKSQAEVFFIPALYYGEYFSLGKQLTRAKKMKIVMDGNSSSGDMVGNTKQAKAIKNAIRYSDIFLPNAQEAKRLTNEASVEAAVHRLGELCPIVVVKDGANGSFCLENGKMKHIPALQIEPIDTTGAGDSFNAGFLRAWLDKLPIEECLRWGNIVGGLSTTEMGGTTRKITLDEVKKHL
jgi:sugar/nucleoside kinase (ribokinase family)